MQAIKRSLLVCVWFMFLTFPILAIRVNTTEGVIEWRWWNVAGIGVGSFLLSFVWRYLLARKERGGGGSPALAVYSRRAREALARPAVSRAVLALSLGVALVLPWVVSTYQVNIMASALIYVGLGLGLNIVVGLTGLLVLGYAAFYAVGAYSYALLYHHFDLGFWTVLPVGGVLAALFGLVLGLPVLRLKGDYLAIVTLGFAEIVRLVLENWNELSFGPSGVAGIARPSLFGQSLGVEDSLVYLYYILLALVGVLIFSFGRLKDSRIGRALLALREDEIACQAMGIDKTALKLTAFALSAAWAGLLGVVFAAKTTFVNPASFTFLESAMVLAIVVLGGMGSISGVVVAALILLLLPEYLRAFSDYRMLLFGMVMVLVMIFRPQGLVSSENRRTSYPHLDRLMREAGEERP